MPDLSDDLKTLADEQIGDLLDDLETSVVPEVKKALKNITFFTAQLVAATPAQREHIQRGIDAELSRLASIASIEISDAQTRAKIVTSKVLGLLLEKALG